MKSKLQKLLSLLLVLAMLTQILPAAVFATEDGGAGASAVGAAATGSEDVGTASTGSGDIGAAAGEDALQAQAADAPADAPAEVLFEEASLREETVKQFRMSDGSYVAVQYDTPVHYQNEIRHAAIITDIRNGLVYYTQHSDSLCDKALTSMKSYDVIYIIRMGD